MQIAIIGAGFCGLAVTWHLIQKGIKNITLFDSHGIGKGASGVAAGLLHAYAGLHAKKSPRADEGLRATYSLLKVAETAIHSSVICNKGLIRLALSQQQKEDYALTASQYPDVYWLTVEECQKKLGASQPHPGIFIDSAIVVDCEKYLSGLWLACQSSGAQFVKKSVNTLKELKHFDSIIITMGAAAKTLPELEDIKITPIKGQVLELTTPPSLATLNYPISSQAYLLAQGDKKTCIAGATFERSFETVEPDLPTALKLIMPKLQAFFPEINKSWIIGCRAGIRASTPDHQPLLAKIGKKNWLLTGMGSKGLLYHALYAEELTNLF